MTAYLTDRWGADIDDTSSEAVERLLDSLPDSGDADADEYGSVSVGDSEGWNLEFSTDHVLLENVEEDSEGRIGVLRDVPRARRIELARMLIDGEVDALRRQGWTPEEAA